MTTPAETQAAESQRDTRPAETQPAETRPALPVEAPVEVCRLGDLVPERGAAALVHGTQVALFRLHDGQVVAVDQRDPYGGAMVMSRGLVGTRGDRPVLASPMHKEVYDLLTGECLDPKGAEPRHLVVHACEVVDGRVRVRLGGRR